jgi:hypothetical protein
MNWAIILPFGILVIALIIFLIKRNQKDEKDFAEGNLSEDEKQKEGDSATDLTQP